MTAAQTTSAAPARTGAAGGGSALDRLIEAPLSLRERKKLKTRQAMRREAYRLFAEQGYDATTVDQIAAAAEVSPSTFFRYFATKEDLVLSDEYDPAMVVALLARPADEPFLATARQTVLGLLRQIFETDRDELLARMRLVNEVPALRARMAAQSAQPRDLLLEVLARRAGVDEPTLEMRVAATAFMAAVSETVLHWAARGGRDALPALMERTFDVLERGLDVCRPGDGPARP